MTAFLTEPQEVADALAEIIANEKGDLGISFVDYGEENVMIPSYPAVVVTPGPVERQVVATHQFGLVLHAEIWVHHADLTIDRKERTRRDLQLATNLKNVLHTRPNNTLGGGVIFGFVSDSRGGLTTAGKSKTIITTRMSYMAESRETW